MMLPVSVALVGNSPMIANDVRDFPEPDSPTNPRTSPGLIEKLRLRTAATVRAPCGEAFGVRLADAGEGRFDCRSGRVRDTLGNSTLTLRTSSSRGTRVWYQRIQQVSGKQLLALSSWLLVLRKNHTPLKAESSKS